MMTLSWSLLGKGKLAIKMVQSSSKALLVREAEGLRPLWSWPGISNIRLGKLTQCNAGPRRRLGTHHNQLCEGRRGGICPGQRHLVELHNRSLQINPFIARLRFQHSGWYTRQNVEASPSVYVGKVGSCLLFLSFFLSNQSHRFQIAHGSYDNWWKILKSYFRSFPRVRWPWVCLGFWLLCGRMRILGGLQVSHCRQHFYLRVKSSMGSWSQPVNPDHVFSFFISISACWGSALN